MKKIISVILILTIALSTLMLLSGCTNDEPKTLVVILATNRNSPMFNINSGTNVNNHIYDAAYTLGEINVIVADGSPYTFSSYNINLNTSVDAEKKRQLATQWASQIAQECKAASPKAKEVDLMEALFLASEKLANVPGEKELVIVSSGLSTSGDLNFADKPYLLNISSSSIVNRLETAHSIPDLSNVSVTWLGFGKTAGIQEKLSKENEHKLREIWSAILTEGSVKSVTFESADFTDEDTSNMPYVSPVVFEEKAIFDDEDFIKLKISFQSDSAVFVDEEEAIEALSHLAAFLNNNPQKILLAGMTATVSDSDGIALSRERSDACKELLIEEFDVDEDLIVSIGLGSRPNSLRKNDTDTNGNLIESVAIHNRAVFACLYDSPIGYELIEFA